MQGTAADEALEQNADPHADPVGRGVEQPRLRRRRHFPGRGRAVATAAPAGPDDSAFVGLDLDLDDGRDPLAVGDVGLPAAGTRARILRRVALLGAFPELGTLHAAMANSAGLLAALAPGARFGLPLALASEQAPSTRRTGSHGASQARLPASRRAMPVPPSRPSGPAPRRAAGRCSRAATRSGRWPVRLPRAADQRARAAT